MKKNKNSRISEKPVSISGDGLDRRDFFRSAWKMLGVLAALELIAVFTAYLFTGKQKKSDQTKKLFEAGPASSFELNSVTAFMGGRFYLSRKQDGGFIALSLRCTHLGCSIFWEADKNRFVCPCHSSAFNISGEVINPPAVRALDYFPVLIENGVIKVDISNLKERKAFSKDQLRYV